MIIHWTWTSNFFKTLIFFFKLQTMFMIIALILYRWNMLLGRKLFQIFGFSRFYFQIEYWLNDRKKEYNYKIRYSWSFFSFQANVCCMLEYYSLARVIANGNFFVFLSWTLTTHRAGKFKRNLASYYLAAVAVMTFVWPGCLALQCFFLLRQLILFYKSWAKTYRQNQSLKFGTPSKLEGLSKFNLCHDRLIYFVSNHNIFLTNSFKTFDIQDVILFVSALEIQICLTSK